MVVYHHRYKYVEMKDCSNYLVLVPLCYTCNKPESYTNLNNPSTLIFRTKCLYDWMI